MGFSKEEMDAKIDAILSFADIGDFIHQPVKVYSSGMFVRLAFAVAVHIEPEILIIDEALAVGDTLFQSKCFDKIKSLMDSGVTTLFVTHNMTTVTSFCNRAIMLDGGSLFAEGTAKDVCLSYFELQRQRENDRQERLTQSRQVMPQSHAASPKTFKASQIDEERRFGSGAAEIVEFKVFNHEGLETYTLATGELFSIRVKIAFHEEVLNPAVGAMIKNPQGQNLMGIHTYHDKRISFGPKKAGDVLTVMFESEMSLNPGRYLLNIGTSHHASDYEYTINDSRHNVAALEVFGKVFSYGIINNRYSVVEL